MKKLKRMQTTPKNNAQNASIVVDSFHGTPWHEKLKFPTFCVYNSPLDFPGKYIVRLFDVSAPTSLIAMRDTLEEARATIPNGYFRMLRVPKDAPSIVETWLYGADAFERGEEQKK